MHHFPRFLTAVFTAAIFLFAAPASAQTRLPDPAEMAAYRQAEADIAYSIMSDWPILVVGSGVNDTLVTLKISIEDSSAVGAWQDSPVEVRQYYVDQLLTALDQSFPGRTVLITITGYNVQTRQPLAVLGRLSPDGTRSTNVANVN